MNDKKKRVYYVKDDEEFEDLIESIVDELCDFKAPARITIEKIDLSEIPGEER